MSKRALKLALTLFLFASGIFLSVANIKDVRAENQTSVYFYRITNDQVIGTSVFTSNASGTLVDTYGHQLYFYLTPQATANDGATHYFITYQIYNNGANITLFFWTDVTQYNQAFNLTFTLKSQQNNSFYLFSGIYSSANPYQNRLYFLVKYLQDWGLQLINGVEITTPGQPYTSSNILDTESRTYNILNAVFKPMLHTESGNENATLEEGRQQVLDNPGLYGLYNNTDLDEAMNTSYENGYNVGVSDGIIQGQQMGSTDLWQVGNIVKKTFDSASSVMNMQIIGPLKLIHFIAIPLLLMLFIIVVKIFRG